MKEAAIPKVVAIIPARGGSKRLPRKNVLPLAGKPLISHSIQQALACPYVESVHVSTDDKEIAEISTSFGAQIIRRPPELALGTSPSEPAILHAMDDFLVEKEDAIILFMQCTSPVRPEDDLKRAIETFVEKDLDSLLSVSPCHVYLWRNSDEGPISVNYDYKNRQRRQDMEPEFNENGSFYLFKPWVLRQLNNRLGGKIGFHVMSECIDIDTEDDFQKAEALMKKMKGEEMELKSKP